MSYAIWTRFRIRSFAEAKKIRNALSESWEKMKAIDPMLIVSRGNTTFEEYCEIWNKSIFKSSELYRFWTNSKEGTIFWWYTFDF